MEVIAHDKQWAENKKMGAFLGVSQGSAQPPVFLEISFQNGPKDQKPIVLIGEILQKYSRCGVETGRNPVQFTVPFFGCFRQGCYF